MKLVRLREDLLERLDKNPRLAQVDADLHHLFHSWFNRGFLVLRRIYLVDAQRLSLKKSSNMKRCMKLPVGRSCVSALSQLTGAAMRFFIQSLVEEPLIFVEVALGE